MQQYEAYARLARLIDEILTDMGANPMSIYGVTNYIDRRLVMSLDYMYAKQHLVSDEQLAELKAAYENLCSYGFEYDIPKSGTYKISIPPCNMKVLFDSFRNPII